MPDRQAVCEWGWEETQQGGRGEEEGVQTVTHKLTVDLGFPRRAVSLARLE